MSNGMTILPEGITKDLVALYKEQEIDTYELLSGIKLISGDRVSAVVAQAMIFGAIGWMMRNLEGGVEIADGDARFMPDYVAKTKKAMEKTR